MNPNVRHLRAALCGLLLLATGCAGGDSDTNSPSAPPSSAPPSMFQDGVNVATISDQPGFNWEDHDTQKYAGFETDLTNFLAEELAFPDIEQHNELTRRREEALTKGTADLVIATYSITVDREKKIDFIGPYFETKQGLLVREDDLRITSQETTAGKRICTVEGTTASPVSPAPHVQEGLKKLMPHAHVDVRANYAACVDELRSRSFDAVWSDLVVLHGFAERFDNVRVVEGLSLGSIQRYGIGIREGMRRECAQIQDRVRLFLTSTRWADAFRKNFPHLTEHDQDFEQHYKPDPGAIARYSCSDD